MEPDYGDNCPFDPFEEPDADTMQPYLKGSEPLGVSRPVALSTDNVLRHLGASIDGGLSSIPETQGVLLPW